MKMDSRRDRDTRCLKLGKVSFILSLEIDAPIFNLGKKMMGLFTRQFPEYDTLQCKMGKVFLMQLTVESSIEVQQNSAEQLFRQTAVEK